MAEANNVIPPHTEPVTIDQAGPTSIVASQDTSMQSPPSPQPDQPYLKRLAVRAADCVGRACSKSGLDFRWWNRGRWRRSGRNRLGLQLSDASPDSPAQSRAVSDMRDAAGTRDR